MPALPALPEGAGPALPSGPPLPTGAPPLPMPALPDAVRTALPPSTPAPPWHCTVEAVVWWHRAGPSAHAAVPAGARPGLPVTVGAFLRYLDSPVGPYDEVLASPLLLRGGALRVSVPFIAVNSVASIAGGRVHWQLPKVLAAFDRSPDGRPAPDGPDASAKVGARVQAAGDGWRLSARASARGPRLPLAARFSSTQDGPTVARSTVRGCGRAARVEVEGGGEGLPAWLVPGRHPGLVLDRARLVVGAPR